MDIELQIEGQHCSGTMGNPDVCGHKYQPCVYVGIGKHVQSLYPQGAHKILMYVDISISCISMWI